MLRKITHSLITALSVVSVAYLLYFYIFRLSDTPHRVDVLERRVLLLELQRKGELSK